MPKERVIDRYHEQLSRHLGHSFDERTWELWGGKNPAARKSAMLSACSISSGCSSPPSCLGTPAPRSRARKPVAAPSARRPDPSHSKPTAGSASRLGQATVGAGSPMVCRLARATEDRDARYGGALASAGLTPVLALEVPSPRRPSTSQPRGAGVDRDHVPRQPAVGHRANQRRAAQAGHRGQQSLDSTLSLARTRPCANPDLAHVPAQPSSPHVGLRSAERAPR